jgi:vancomycin resistance protein YoaR
MDATVDWGTLDYKFTNTLQYPIYIESIVKDKILTFNVYSNSSLNNRTYNMVHDVYETTQPGPVKYIDDPTLPVGQEVQDQFPLTGYKVKVYKDTIENGKVIDHTLLSDDRYPMVAEVIKKGTKAN